MNEYEDKIKYLEEIIKELEEKIKNIEEVVNNSNIDDVYHINKLLKDEVYPNFIDNIYCEYYYTFEDETAVQLVFVLKNKFNKKDIGELNKYIGKIKDKYRIETDYWIYDKTEVKQ